MNPWALREAARVLRAGGVVACPTEAVFGLSCDPADPEAVARLLALKRRPPSKGLILVAADPAQLAPWLAPLEPQAHARLLSRWPGPHTWIAPAATATPDYLTGARHSLAVRVTAHPPLAALCRAFGGALVSTSANLSGRPPARDRLAIRRQFGDNLDYLLPGPLGGLSAPTGIQDLLGGSRIR